MTPFVYQVEYWATILEEIAKHLSGKPAAVIHDDKSRQMGMSWATAIFVLWQLSFKVWPGLVLSYKDEKVDDGGKRSTTDSLFGKVRFLWEHLPEELRAPLIFYPMQIINEETQCYVKGETTNPTSLASGGGGRGGSYVWGLWDEAAFGPHSHIVWRGFKRAARVPILLSTPNGKAGIFGWLKFNATSGVRFLRQYWMQHPIFGLDAYFSTDDNKWHSPWYDEQCATMTPEDIARELDISYEASVKGRAFPEFNFTVHNASDLTYQGGKLIAGWDFGIRATAISLYEILPGAEATEVRCLDAMEFANALPTQLAQAFQAWKIRYYKDIKSWGDPAGKARQQNTGTSPIDELAKLGVIIDAPLRLRDCSHRIKTSRQILRGGEISGKKYKFVFHSRLNWFAECIEQARWPTDRDGEVRGIPTDLEDNEYTHHADAFSLAMEGSFGGTSPKMPGADRTGDLLTRVAPLTAGWRRKGW